MAQKLPLGVPSQLPRATRRALRGADALGPAERVSLSVLLCLWYLKFASPEESSGTSPVMQPCSKQHAGTSAHLRCQVGTRCVRYGEVCREHSVCRAATQPQLSLSFSGLGLGPSLSLGLGPSLSLGLRHVPLRRCSGAGLPRATLGLSCGVAARGTQEAGARTRAHTRHGCTRGACQHRCLRGVPRLDVQRAERSIVDRPCTLEGANGRHWHGSTAAPPAAIRVWAVAVLLGASA